MNVQKEQKLPFELSRIFAIQDDHEFQELALKVFEFQHKHSEIYRQFIQLTNRKTSDIQSIEDIPFLPISFFKTHTVTSFLGTEGAEFLSSGTTSNKRSRHLVADPSIYQQSFLKGFEHFYGNLKDYIILGLLPSYLESDKSSLVYMVDQMIELTGDDDSGFFLNDYAKLIDIVDRRRAEKKIIIIGVSFALLDLAEKHSADLSGCIIMETGGMKGKRKEITRDELHSFLKEKLNLNTVHSEYGMTELLSQAYSKKEGIFCTPPWMKVLIRKPTDPFEIFQSKSGGINIIDLANIYSCSFIETEDLGRKNSHGFEVLGRLDNSDIRGCNLLIE
jgi:phenylacetate-coenzyme A ligase PaaK-like adenylate-forming protein